MKRAWRYPTHGNDALMGELPQGFSLVALEPGSEVVEVCDHESEIAQAREEGRREEREAIKQAILDYIDDGVGLPAERKLAMSDLWIIIERRQEGQ